MVKPLGRPPSNNPKRNDTRIRMTDDEVRMLEHCSDIMQISKSDVIRVGIKRVYEDVTKKK